MTNIADLKPFPAPPKLQQPGPKLAAHPTNLGDDLRLERGGLVALDELDDGQPAVEHGSERSADQQAGRGDVGHKLQLGSQTARLAGRRRRANIPREKHEREIDLKIGVGNRRTTSWTSNVSDESRWPIDIVKNSGIDDISIVIEEKLPHMKRIEHQW